MVPLFKRLLATRGVHGPVGTVGRHGGEDVVPITSPLRLVQRTAPVTEFLLRPSSLEEVGLFRVPGRDAESKVLIAHLRSGEGSVPAGLEVHEYDKAYKQLLKDILGASSSTENTRQFLGAFKDALGIQDPANQSERIKAVFSDFLRSLPIETKYFVLRLLELSTAIVANSEQNKMTVQNLGVALLQSFMMDNSENPDPSLLALEAKLAGQGQKLAGAILNDSEVYDALLTDMHDQIQDGPSSAYEGVAMRYVQTGLDAIILRNGLRAYDVGVPSHLEALPATLAPYISNGFKAAVADANKPHMTHTQDEPKDLLRRIFAPQNFKGNSSLEEAVRFTIQSINTLLQSDKGDEARNLFCAAFGISNPISNFLEAAMELVAGGELLNPEYGERHRGDAISISNTLAQEVPVSRAHIPDRAAPSVAQLGARPAVRTQTNVRARVADLQAALDRAAVQDAEGADELGAPVQGDKTAKAFDKSVSRGLGLGKVLRHAKAAMVKDSSAESRRSKYMERAASLLDDTSRPMLALKGGNAFKARTAEGAGGSLDKMWTEYKLSGKDKYLPSAETPKDQVALLLQRTADGVLKEPGKDSRRTALRNEWLKIPREASLDSRLGFVFDLMESDSVVAPPKGGNPEDSDAAHLNLFFKEVKKSIDAALEMPLEQLKVLMPEDAAEFGDTEESKRVAIYRLASQRVLRPVVFGTKPNSEEDVDAATVADTLAFTVCRYVDTLDKTVELDVLAEAHLQPLIATGKGAGKNADFQDAFASIVDDLAQVMSPDLAYEMAQPQFGELGHEEMKSRVLHLLVENFGAAPSAFSDKRPQFQQRVLNHLANVVGIALGPNTPFGSRQDGTIAKQSMDQLESLLGRVFVPPVVGENRELVNKVGSAIIGLFNDGRLADVLGETPSAKPLPIQSAPGQKNQRPGHARKPSMAPPQMAATGTSTTPSAKRAEAPAPPVLSRYFSNPKAGVPNFASFSDGVLTQLVGQLATYKPTAGQPVEKFNTVAKALNAVLASKGMKPVSLARFKPANN